MFNKIAIIGLGLIGGSLAKRIKKIFPRTLISGLARSKDTVNYALQNGFIDETATELEMVVHGAELIIIATPIELIAKYVKEVYKFTEPETIIVDVASSKAEICSALKKYSDKFIGGHPMAGTEKTGIRQADAKIFDNAVYVLTPYQKTPKSKLKQLVGFIESLGMRSYQLDPVEHDQAVAAISHLPYILASTLLQNADNKHKKTLAATGFKSTTRVGESAPEWGVEIARTNKKALLQQLALFQENLNKLKKLISAGQYAKLQKVLKANQAIRRSIYP